MTLVHELLMASATNHGTRSALVYDGITYTYLEIARRSAAYAVQLRAAGLRRGDRVVVDLPNSVDSVATVFGVLMAGGCFVVVDPTMPVTRLAAVIDNCRPHVLVTLAARPDRLLAVQDASENCPRLLWDHPVAEIALVVGDPAGRPDGPAAVTDIGPDDLATIIYTSGSTGSPKGVTLSHANVVYVTLTVGDYLAHTESDVVVSVLQLAFGYGLLQLLVTFASGALLVLQRGFGFPYDVVKTLATYGATGFAGVPTQFAMMLRLDGIDAEDLSTVRYVTNAGAAMPPALIPKLRTAFPCAELFLMHGQTECLRTSFLPPDEIERRPGSIGRGMEGVEMWLEGDDGRVLANGGQGELMVRSPGVMVGYWDDPAATAEVICTGGSDADRVLRTRDIFRTDLDGYFSFVGRMDDIFKSRGEKISPTEIEDALYTCDQLAEVRVRGIADEVLGYTICAEVVLTANATITERELKAHLRSRLEPYKIPQQIVFVESLPKTLNGKIRRSG